MTRKLRTNLIAARREGKARYTGKICLEHPELSGERYVCNSRCVACALNAVMAHARSEQGKARIAAYEKTPKAKAMHARFKARYNRSERGRALKALCDARYNAKYPGKRAARVAAWYAANPGKHQLHRQNYKVRKRTQGDGLSWGIVDLLLEEQGGRCAYCFAEFATDGYHLDHFLPLALGGAHSDENMVLACPGCNLRKNRKHPLKFLSLIG